MGRHVPGLLSFQACLETSPRRGAAREDAIEIKLALSEEAGRVVFTFSGNARASGPPVPFRTPRCPTPTAQLSPRDTRTASRADVDYGGSGLNRRPNRAKLHQRSTPYPQDRQADPDPSAPNLGTKKPTARHLEAGIGRREPGHRVESQP